MAAGPEAATSTSELRQAKQWRTLLVRALLWAVLWGLLTAGQGWWFFLALLPFLLWSAWLWPVPLLRVRWRYLPSFLGYFFQQMWWGGLDVAWRACRVTPAISPNWQRYTVRLQHASSQRVMACLISLMPGTTACRGHMTSSTAVSTDPAAPAWLELHILNQHDDWSVAVSQLERRLSQLLAVETPLC
jgi:multicomponent Na+:H+ antiporter subunit E